MKEKEVNHYIESLLYLMEQTVVYFRIKASQVFASNNVGVTADQFAALDAIYCNDDICQRDLSKIILKDRSNTGRILNILEEKGFIKRELETKGKRPVKKLYITTLGKELVEETIPKIKPQFHPVFENLSEEELLNLKQTLKKMKDSLSKTTSIQI